eukprot:TRINITY_DN103720_c0_g1_i2.p2 TRINITY_DN103720_c0_g1~~TRINITY_DN103720_c0_g1_i2.p2  ORF type:complete len:197 (-),score=28.95 TRINITY_DN103720_c0_g1_i2:241-801(-)
MASEYAAGTLKHLTRKEEGSFQAWEAKGPRVLLKTIKSSIEKTEEEFEEGEGFRREAAGCLAQLCRHEYGKVQVLQAEGVKVLALLLWREASLLVDSQAVINILQAFASISIDVEAKVPVIKEAGGQMASMYRFQNQAILSNLDTIFVNCSEHPVARQEMYQVLSSMEFDRLAARMTQMPPDFRFV